VQILFLDPRRLQTNRATSPFIDRYSQVELVGRKGWYFIRIDGHHLHKGICARSYGQTDVCSVQYVQYVSESKRGGGADVWTRQ
jgi:hypothetical protein